MKDWTKCFDVYICEKFAKVSESDEKWFHFIISAN
jgi:hypothetical protein